MLTADIKVTYPGTSQSIDFKWSDALHRDNSGHRHRQPVEALHRNAFAGLPCPLPELSLLQILVDEKRVK